MGFLITGVLFWKIRLNELEQFHERFTNDAAVRTHVVQDNLHNCLLVNEMLTQLFYASDMVEPHEFRTFTLPLLTRTHEISAIAWVPVVPHEKRAGFEEYGQRAVSPAFNISEYEQEAGLVSAGQRDFYYPLFYIEPANSYYGNDLGFDTGSVPELLATLTKAEETGKPAVCGKMDLMRNGKQVILVIVPFHKRDVRVDQAGGADKGFVVTIIQEDDLLKSISQSIGPDEFDFVLHDESAPTEEGNIVSHVSGLPGYISWRSHFSPDPPQFFQRITFADRSWHLKIMAGREYMERNYPLAFWVFLPVGMLLTLILGLYLSSVFLQRNRLEYLVGERTAELQASEEKYRLLAENAHDVIWVLDLDLHYTYVSPSVKNLRGYDADEVLRQNLEDVLTPDSYRKATDMFRTKVFNQPDRDIDRIESRTLELEMYRRDGSTVWTEVIASPLCDQNGVVRGIMGVTRDISERKISEEALRESEEKYRQVVENANEAISVIQDGMFRFVNSKHIEIIGYSRDALLAAPFSQIIHPEDRAMVMERYAGRLGGEGLPTIYMFRIVNKAGQTIWVENNSIHVTWAGRPATLNFLTDISDRVQAEEQARVLEGRLTQAQKMESIGTLAGGIAHDFNNILSSVLGYTGLARMKVENEQPVGEELDQIMKAGLRARDLVKQILTFSRQAEIRKEPVIIASIIKESMKLLRASLPTTIEIRQDLDAPGATVMADPTQIHQIIMNLITNASHAMPDSRGMINVELKEVDLDEASIQYYQGLEAGRYLRLSISDTGAGIHHTIIDKIFDPFFTTKQRGEGTGLGLSVVHGIVKDMGGAISVYSEHGIGTTFNILWPVSRPDAVHVSKSAAGMKTGTGRILFVDDEEGILESGRKILEHLGYHVVFTTSAANALEIFRQDPDAFDLVLTDMTMPRMTGLELSEFIHEIRPHIPIVLCTGFSSEIMEERIKDAGIRDVVMKPMVPDELADVVHKALNPDPL